MIAVARPLVAGLDRRLSTGEDQRAAARGWQVQRTGRLGLGRVYIDPRWSAGQFSQSAHQGVSDHLPWMSTAAAGRGLDAVGQRWSSLPDHLTQGEEAPYVQG